MVAESNSSIAKFSSQHHTMMEVEHHRRKKYSVVTQDSEIPSPFRGGGSKLSTEGDVVTSPGINGKSVGTLDSTTFNGDAHVSGDCTKEVLDKLVMDIDRAVSHDPCITSTPAGQPGDREQKTSVYSMYQDADDKLEMRLLLLGEIQRGQLMRELVTSFQQKVLLCLEHYDPGLTLTCLRVITSLSTLKPPNHATTPSRKVKTDAWNVTDENDPQRPFKRSENQHKIRRIGVTSIRGKSTKQVSIKRTKFKDIQEDRSSSPQQDTDKWADRCLNPFSELDVEGALNRELPIFTISRVRNTVQQILRRATLRQDGSVAFSSDSRTAVATRSVQYYVWFFEFMDYLHELHVSFTDRIFAPLFKYFNDTNFLSTSGRTNTVSSALSHFSRFTASSDTHSAYESDFDSDDVDRSVQKSKFKQLSKSSLLQLSKEYREIKSIYDTSELDKIAERLSFVKEQIDYLFDEEDEIDPDFYSEESAKMLHHLDMDFGTENLIRLVPDILVKLKKAAWLAGKWLDLDAQRTKDAKDKLDQLMSIEDKLTQRLNFLNHEIISGEKRLEKETNELGRSVEREGRTDVISFKADNIDSHVQKLETKLKSLNKEKERFSQKLAHVVKTKNFREFQRLKYNFESNKLQRFLTERKLDTLRYQTNLLRNDLAVEVYVKPSVIHSTNRLQDECERLEQHLRLQRAEAGNIRHALVPVHEDKESLVRRLSRERQDGSSNWLADPTNASLSQFLLYPGRALYVRSFPGTKFENDYMAGYRKMNGSQTHREIRVPSHGHSLSMQNGSMSERTGDMFPVATMHPITSGSFSHHAPVVNRRAPINIGNNRSLRAVSPPTW